MKIRAPPFGGAPGVFLSAVCGMSISRLVNLQNMHLQLTKNPFAGRLSHLCGAFEILPNLWGALPCAWLFLFLERESENSAPSLLQTVRAVARRFALSCPLPSGQGTPAIPARARFMSGRTKLRRAAVGERARCAKRRNARRSYGCERAEDLRGRRAGSGACAKYTDISAGRAL